MKYTLIITPRNVVWRLFVAVLLMLCGIEIIQPPNPSPPAVVVGLLVLAIGLYILFFALRWFWRLFIVAWFR